MRATPEQVAAASPQALPTRPPTASAPAVLPDVDDDAGRTPTAIQRAAVVEMAIEHDRSPGWQQRMGETALARLAYPWQAIGYRVSFLPARSGYLGMTFPERRLIEMYVRENATVDDLARNVGHELGHAFDFTYNTDATRLMYRQIRGIEPTGGWLACRGCTDLSTPAGDFAETFSYFLMDGAFPSRSKLGGGSPSHEQLQQLAPLFAAA